MDKGNGTIGNPRRLYARENDPMRECRSRKTGRISNNVAGVTLTYGYQIDSSSKYPLPFIQTTQRIDMNVAGKDYC